MAIAFFSMATSLPILAQMSRICISSGRPSFQHLPATLQGPKIAIRHKHGVPKIASKKEKGGSSQANAMKHKKKDDGKKKRKPRTTYRQYDLKDAEQFSLCEAMRYVQFP